MEQPAVHKFEFPVVETTDISPEERIARNARFMRVAAAASVNNTLGRRARSGKFGTNPDAFEEARNRRVLAEAKRRIVNSHDEE